MTDYDPTPLEVKIDPDKYRVMTFFEAQRAMQEDRRRAMEEGPRTQAVLRDMKERERSRQAEEENRAEGERRRREAEAAKGWEEERARRRAL